MSMHNGDLGGFTQLRRSLLGQLSDEAFGLIRGSTDSEHIFALYIDHYRATPGEGAALGRPGLGCRATRAPALD